MQALSLFSGIGGFDKGFAEAGIKSCATVELDACAQGVLRYHWPQVPHLSDIRDVTIKALDEAGVSTGIDVIHGGFPCQDVSVAGGRRGMGEDTRSGLFWESIRVVEEVRPTWVVIENVPGLLSSNRGRDMGAVLGSLAELGYGYAYRVLDSRFFGTVQRRRRLFIVGCHGSRTGASQVLFESPGRAGHSPTGSLREDKPSAPEGAQDHESVMMRCHRFSEYRIGAPVVMARDFKGNRGIVLNTRTGRVRWTTPGEHEKLQRFPLDWTRYRTSPGGVTVEQSDSQRFKQIGNAVVVSMATAIAQNIQHARTASRA